MSDVLRIFATTGLDHVIPHFAGLEEALRQRPAAQKTASCAQADYWYRARWELRAERSAARLAAVSLTWLMSLPAGKAQWLTVLN
jgi:hypothetical protein